MIRGRLLRSGRPGLKGLTLRDFCDLVWVEIMDDCPPLGDHTQYREIMVRLFIDGDEPADIWWVDGDGKRHRLTEGSGKRRSGGSPSKAQMDQLAALNARMAQAKEAATERARAVASPPDE